MNCILPSIPAEFEYSEQIMEEQNFFDVDPMFSDPPENGGIETDALSADWTVPINSTAVNNGTTDIEGIEFPPVDLGGNERIAYGIIDIGPHEFY
ncbi:MAG: hypothetical protein KAT15_07870, partial [Bacteroidales bacterium]|nr:hypothetical protein [Bacteroidales bacterium]